MQCSALDWSKVREVSRVRMKDSSSWINNVFDGATPGWPRWRDGMNKKGQGLTAGRQTQMWEGATCDVSGVIVEMCIVWSHCFKCVFHLFLHTPNPTHPHPLSLLSPFLPFTCITLPSRSPSPLQATEKEKESPVELTERCFRELLGRAAYGNIKNAVTPVLMWVSCVKTSDMPVMHRMNL